MRDIWPPEIPSFRAKTLVVSSPLASRSLRRTILDASISLENYMELAPFVEQMRLVRKMEFPKDEWRSDIRTERSTLDFILGLPVFPMAVVVFVEELGWCNAEGAADRLDGRELRVLGRFFQSRNRTAANAKLIGVGANAQLALHFPDFSLHGFGRLHPVGRFSKISVPCAGQLCYSLGAIDRTRKRKMKTSKKNAIRIITPASQNRARPHPNLPKPGTSPSQLAKNRQAGNREPGALVRGPRSAAANRKPARRAKSTKAAKAPARRQPVYTLEEDRSHRYRAMHFPAVEGKTTARVELVTSDDHHAVVVVFDDNTAVGFEFQPCFTIQAFGEDINAVGGKGSKNWPKILSER